ncbi:MAG: DUF445 family protein [Defluviitaleaceae bacterium]|nr:DUF445 family protein [Defluviitaleaceae bacterium]
MDIINFLIMPILGGIIAMSTNWLAIKMLFHPHKEIRIWGIKLPFTPGLVPKERERLAKRLAEAVSTKLLTPEVLALELADASRWPIPDMTIGEALATIGVGQPKDIAVPMGERLKLATDNLLPRAIAALENFPEAYPALDKKLAEFTYKVIDENVGRIAGMFISKEKIYASIKEGVIGYLTNPENLDEIYEKSHGAIDALMSNEDTQNAIIDRIYSINIRDGLTAFFQKEKHAVNRVLSLLAGYVAKNMPIQEMIEKKIAAFDVGEMEEIILSVAGKELRLIVLLGGVLGFIVGLFANFL